MTMHIKKNKGFTLVELVITMAVSVIVLTMVASLAFATSKISSSQQVSSSSLSSYVYAKSQIESFVSEFTNDKFSFKTTKESIINPDTFLTETTKSIIVSESNSETIVAWIEYKENRIYLYKLNKSNEKELASSLDATYFENVDFSIFQDLAILKCKIKLKSSHNYSFLIDLGGAYLGN